MRRVGLAAGTTTTTGSGDLVNRPRAAPWCLPFGFSNVLTPPRTPRPCSSLSGRGRVGRGLPAAPRLVEGWWHRGWGVDATLTTWPHGPMAPWALVSLQLGGDSRQPKPLRTR